MSTKTTWSLAERLERVPTHVNPLEQQFQALKAEIHQQLVESLDLSEVTSTDNDYLRFQVRSLAEEAAYDRREILGQVDRERLVEELMAEIFGLGPLERLFDDPDITDILVNDPYTVYIERHGRLELTEVMFADTAHLLRIIQRIVARIGRRIDEVSPMVDARLPDGSRVNAVVPPLALDGPSVSIRRFGAKPLEMEDLLRFGSVTPEIVDFIGKCIEARIGIVFSGGTGAGKTTLLNAASKYIPEEERVVTIEDSAELILQNRHRVRLETRPANTEGRGEFSQRDLVRNSLRMRPDRILVGEVRGPEVWDMLQAMNTGHEGSLTTIHSNSATDTLARLEMMVAMTGFDLPIEVVRQYIASGIGLVVHGARLKGGVRRIMEITEVKANRKGEYELQRIFEFKQKGLDADGRANGSFFATGNLPTFLDRMRDVGVDVDDEMFAERKLG